MLDFSLTADQYTYRIFVCQNYSDKCIKVDTGHVLDIYTKITFTFQGILTINYLESTSSLETRPEPKTNTFFGDLAESLLHQKLFSWPAYRPNLKN